MKICGRNEEYQLSETSNEKSTSGIQCISPPINSNLNIPVVLSFSIYSLHSVWIENDGRGFAVGYNGDGSILSNLSKDTFREEKEIIIKDKSGNNCMILSAMCGSSYTLYLISGNSGSNNELVYNSVKSPTHIFLNINDLNPIRLFGGNKISAAITTDGSILLITEDVFNSPTTPIKSLTLPTNSKAISVACCNDFVIALDIDGHTFINYMNSSSGFSQISELNNKKIVDISGSFEHCFAVSEDGTVFCCGSNDFGQLGIGRKPANLKHFTEVSSLSKYQITAAYAGYSHSLFQTSSGMILACGGNICGELLLDSPPSEEKIYTPVETSIKSDAIFCIAGECLSAVFYEFDPPPKTPNMKVYNNL